MALTIEFLLFSTLLGHIIGQMRLKLPVGLFDNPPIFPETDTRSISIVSAIKRLLYLNWASVESRRRQCFRMYLSSCNRDRGAFHT